MKNSVAHPFSGRPFSFCAFVLVTFFAAGPVVLAQTVIINEVDADQAGSDAAEFVELYDGGIGNTNLSGLSIVLFNGSDDRSYRA